MMAWTTVERMLGCNVTHPPPPMCTLERWAFIIFCAALAECDSTLPINYTDVRHGAGVFSEVLRTLVSYCRSLLWQLWWRTLLHGLLLFSRLSGPISLSGTTTDKRTSHRDVTAALTSVCVEKTFSHPEHPSPLSSLYVNARRIRIILLWPS